MEPLEAAVIATFTKRLPADISRAVNLQPHTLEEAYTTASFMENSVDSNIIPDTRYKTYQSNPRTWGAMSTLPRAIYPDSRMKIALTAKHTIATIILPAGT